MGSRKRFGLAVLLLLPGCAPAPTPVSAETPPYQCILPSERRMLVAEMFFGRDRAGRRAVSDADWADFLSTVITPNFPDGLTVFDGYGQWRNPETGIIGRSPGVKIVLIAINRSPDLPGRLNAVIDAYKARFHQQSVGIITRDSCAAF
ncbi:MAG TPA: DUF3574 domain-containing protein [Stellaceae bacterium]|nr:DUF3574 domain-containing protein [Stellaceae bacterium]